MEQKPGRFFSMAVVASLALGGLLLTAPSWGQRATATRSSSSSSDSQPSTTVQRSPSASSPSTSSSGSSTPAASSSSSSSSTSRTTARRRSRSSGGAEVTVGGSSSSHPGAHSNRQRDLRSEWRHRPPRPSHGSHHGGYSYYPYGGWDRYWWGTGWGWGIWPYGWWGHTYYGSPRYGAPRVVYVESGDYVGSRDYTASGAGMGALDLDIDPEETEVWVDGGLVGAADDFDGFPSYLWLEAGTHELVFYHPGRETLVRTVDLRDGELLGFDDRLVPGVSRSPQELFTRRDNNAAAVAQRRPPATRPSVEDEFDEDELEDQEVWSDSVEGTGRLVLSVSPADAAVWLDGRLIGSAADLNGLRDALLVAAGSHEVVAVRPGWGELRRRVVVPADGEATLTLDLRD